MVADSSDWQANIVGQSRTVDEYIALAGFSGRFLEISNVGLKKSALNNFSTQGTEHVTDAWRLEQGLGVSDARITSLIPVLGMSIASALQNVITQQGFERIRIAVTNGVKHRP